MADLLHQLLDLAAEAVPDKEAIRFEGRALSYEALRRRANRTARALQEVGVRRGDRVGLYLAKGIESVVALYGVLKVGAAYVPLDPWLPPERLAAVIADCGIRGVFASADRAVALDRARRQGAGLDWVMGDLANDGEWTGLSWAQIEQRPDGSPSTTVETDQLAYILYTSGSTGEPKGMMHTHRSGLSFVEWAARTFGVRSDDRIGNHAPLHFDLSMFDLFCAASAHATTVIVSEERQKLPATLPQLIQDERLSIWYSVPVAWTQMLTRGALDGRELDTLRLVLFGGEPFPDSFLRAAMVAAPQAVFWHLYGVTEANVCTAYRVPRPLPDDSAALPIGHLRANMDAVVLEGDLPVGRDTIGELAVSGDAVMDGYWNRPTINAQAFWSRTDATGCVQRFYRTGDLVRRDATGLFQFSGRADRQIKSRGHRIELDEVQAALSALPSVEEAAVFATSDGEGSQRLEAAVAVRTPDWNEADARCLLRSRTALYAVPATFRVVDKLPRTSAGKVDFMALRRAATQLD